MQEMLAGLQEVTMMQKQNAMKEKLPEVLFNKKLREERYKARREGNVKYEIKL